MKKCLVIAITVILSLSACNQYEKSEVVLYYLPDSIPQMKVYYKKNGDKEYIAKEDKFFRNGQIMQSGYFDQNHKKTGKWITYFGDGKIQRIEHYKEDMKNGKFIEYYPTGKKMYEANYKMGLPDGKWIIYNVDGKINSKLIYKNGDLISEK